MLMPLEGNVILTNEERMILYAYYIGEIRRKMDDQNISESTILQAREKKNNPDKLPKNLSLKEQTLMVAALTLDTSRGFLDKLKPKNPVFLGSSIDGLLRFINSDQFSSFDDFRKKVRQREIPDHPFAQDIMGAIRSTLQESRPEMAQGVLRNFLPVTDKRWNDLEGTWLMVGVEDFCGLEKYWDKEARYYHMLLKINKVESRIYYRLVGSEIGKQGAYDNTLVEFREVKNYPWTVYWISDAPELRPYHCLGFIRTESKTQGWSVFSESNEILDLKSDFARTPFTGLSFMVFLDKFRDENIKAKMSDPMRHVARSFYKDIPFFNEILDYLAAYGRPTMPKL